MALGDLDVQNLESDTAKLGDCSCEVLIHQILRKADCLEALRASVAGNCGDAHLGHDL